MYELRVTYDQLVMLALLLQPANVEHSWRKEAAVVRAFVNAELARANLLARQCLECG